MLLLADCYWNGLLVALHTHPAKIDPKFQKTCTLHMGMSKPQLVRDIKRYLQLPLLMVVWVLSFYTVFVCLIYCFFI